MKKNVLFLSVAILLFSFCSTHDDSRDAGRNLTIRSEVSESLAPPTSSGNATFAETDVSNNQTVILRNPTFQELRDFILKDPTSRKQFITNQYECRNFATDVVNNAFNQGILCGFVLLCFDQGQHAVVAFNTTDRGLIFIEPQTDAAIEPKVGGDYMGKKVEHVLIAW